jgi:glucose-1-phosphate thymidylyltransferase
MLLYGLEHLRNAGIREVGVMLGPIRECVTKVIGYDSPLCLNVTYIEQPDPRGLAHAVKISKDYIGDDSFVMYLGDNMLREGVRGFVNAFKQGGCDCVVGVTPVKDLSRFGVVKIEEGKPPRFVEKPKEPRINLALVGVYVLNTSVFDAVDKIKPSWRNELEITDAIQALVESGKKVAVERVRGWWKDTGKPEDLLEANQLVLSDLEGHVEAEMSGEANVTGRVSIGAGSKLAGNTRIRWPRNNRQKLPPETRRLRRPVHKHR